MTQKLLSKLMLLLALFVAGMSTALAEETAGSATLTWSEQGLSNSTSVDGTAYNVGDYFTVTCAKNSASTAPTYYTNGTAVRCYATKKTSNGNTITVACKTGVSNVYITKVTYSGTHSKAGTTSFTYSGSPSASDATSATYSSSDKVTSASATLCETGGSKNGQFYFTSVTVDYVVVSDGGETPTLEASDFAISGAPVALTFDLYNNSATQTVAYTTSGTGAVTVSESEYVTTTVSDGTITVTPVKATPSAQTITVSQAADDTYAAGTATFTVTVDDSTPSTDAWVLASLADLAEGDVFVIVGNNGSNYALSNSNGTGSAPSAVAVTVADDKITSTVADNLKWNISGNATDGYTFYPNGSTTTWLYVYNNNNGVRVGTGTDKTFEVQSNYLYNTGQKRYVGIYSSQDWRSYTSINNNIQNQTFAFYKKVSLTDPAISASDVNLAYDATSGSISFTIANPQDGGAVTAVSSETWLTVGTVGASSVALSCEANAAATERTATVTLTYTYNTSETVTKSVTVTQAANPDVVLTIAEARAQGTGSVHTKGIVTSVNGKTAYIQDATAAIVVFGSSNLSVAVGDEIDVEGSLTTYNGLLEIGSPTYTVKSSGNTVTPEVMTIAEVNASTKQGWLVKIEEATVSAISSQNVTVAQGENTVVVRFNDANDITFAVNDAITLTGNIGYYNGVQIANPTDVTVVENTDPIITVATTTVEAPAAGADGTIAVTYDNITDVMAEVFFCDAEGNAATYDWIEAEIDDDNNLTYLVDENTDTEARTAYMKVYALGDDASDVYSDLITVTQAGYVPDYATLPFAWDTTEAPAGVTQSTGGTYKASPYVKFDKSEQWLVLKINEAPGEVSFDVKGNPSNNVWEGTFEVLTSADGETYTSVATYTDLESTAETKTIYNLSEDVRYIKWTYTKTTGNVALGNIKVEKPIKVKLNASGYATFASTKVLDFSAAEEKGFTAWAVTAVNGTTITFSQITEAVPAGTGVLLKGTASTEYTVATAAEGNELDNLLVGITEETEISDGEYYGLSGNTFLKVTAGTVKAGKALLPASVVETAAGVKVLSFIFEDDPTGIVSPLGETEEGAAIYNLAGQRIQKMQKGVNIVGGRKVLY